MRDNQLSWRKRLAKITAVLLGTATLVVFYPLAGCGKLNNPPLVKPGQTQIVARTPSPTGTTGPRSPWQLVWSDEFDGPPGALPDPNKWSVSVGGGGWGNQQLDYDTYNQNAYLDGQGNLVIEARRDTSGHYQCWYGPCQYTSAQLKTQGHFSFTYGKIEARMKIPYGQGLWSAFWLLGDNCDTVGWPTCGEIDIMENIGKQPNIVYGTVHGPGYFSGTYTLPHGNFSDDFHVYGLQWTPNSIAFFVDGINYATLNRSYFSNPGDWVYNHPFHIVLNVPVGGTWPGSPNASTVFPQKMYVSYVRVYASV